LQALAASADTPQEHNFKNGNCPPLRIYFGKPDLSTPPLRAVLPVLLDTGEDQAVSAFQFSVAHSCSRVVVKKVVEGRAVEDIGGADFFVSKEFSNGVHIGAVLDLQPGGNPPRFRLLPACTSGQEIVLIFYECGSSTERLRSACVLYFDDTIGDPPVPMAVALGGRSVKPEAGPPAGFTLWCYPAVPFVRGDVNQDGRWTMSDAIAVARALFKGGAKWDLVRECRDAADVNDDGRLNAADPVYLLQFLFIGGPPPPPPRTCGMDQTPSNLLPCIRNDYCEGVK